MKPKVRRLCCDYHQSFSRIAPICTHKDEVASNVRRTGLVACVRIVEVPDVVCLQDEHNDPVYAGHHGVQGKRRIIVVILAPDGVTSTAMFAVCWFVKGVVCSDNHDDQPRNDGEDLVGDEVASTELLAFRERVVYLKVSRVFNHVVLASYNP